MTLRTVLLHLSVIGGLVGAISSASADALISGTATYRERIALPPAAVFEAVLEEVSRADAPAAVIGRTRIDNPGQPPIAFSIAYDPAAIDPRFTYAVRTTVRVGDRLMFTSDTVNRVLTRGAPSDVAIVMRGLARQSAAADDPPTPAPATVIGGMFVYMADAARLTDCRTGASYPVAMEGDYLRLEKAYTAARGEPGEPLLVTFAGSIEQRPRMEGEGTDATAVVQRFINVWPDENCERNRADASLTDTYWRIVRLGDEDVVVAEKQREPHIVLHTDKERFNATVGCNRMLGGYQLSGASLRFGNAASTMMACPPPLDGLERKLSEVLSATAGWSIYGQFLELTDANGRPLALLRAVYLR